MPSNVYGIHFDDYHYNIIIIDDDCYDADDD